jgi:hypothetical protein
MRREAQVGAGLWGPAQPRRPHHHPFPSSIEEEGCSVLNVLARPSSEESGASISRMMRGRLAAMRFQLGWARGDMLRSLGAPVHGAQSRAMEA